MVLLGSHCANLWHLLPVFMGGVTPVSCSFLWCKVRVSCCDVISQHRALSSFLSCASSCHIVQEGGFVHSKHCL